MPDVFSMLSHMIEKIFPGEKDLRKEKGRNLWNPIVNADWDSKDAADRRKEIRRLITTHQGLLVEMDQQRERKSFVLRRALLDMRMGQILSWRS